MMRSTSWKLRAALTILASTAVWAQGTPPQGAPAQTGAQTKFTSSIDFVRWDVTPRDEKTKQFIPNLNKEDFTLLEDGVPQKIETKVLVFGGRSLSDVIPPAVAPPPGIILPPQRPTQDASGRIIIVFIDDLHIEFKLTPRLRQMLKQISDYLIHDGDLFTMVSTGYSSIEQGLTYDRKRIPEIISHVSGAGLKPSDIVKAASTSQGPAEVRYRANTAFSTAYDLLGQLAKITDRRKAFVYISSGYDFNPFADARQRADAQSNAKGGSTELGQADPNPVDPSLLTNPFEQQQNEFSDADLARELSELTRQANRANVNFYPIDPRGLSAGPDMDEQEVSTAEYLNNVRKSQDSLRVIADLTGGFATVNQNDFVKALKAIDNAESDYYILGYYSSNPDPLRRKRQIEIRVNRPNTELIYKKEYTLKPPPKAIK